MYFRFGLFLDCKRSSGLALSTGAIPLGRNRSSGPCLFFNPHHTIPMLSSQHWLAAKSSGQVPWSEGWGQGPWGTWESVSWAHRLWGEGRVHTATLLGPEGRQGLWVSVVPCPCPSGQPGATFSFLVAGVDPVCLAGLHILQFPGLPDCSLPSHTAPTHPRPQPASPPLQIRP